MNSRRDYGPRELEFKNPQFRDDEAEQAWREAHYRGTREPQLGSVRSEDHEAGKKYGEEHADDIEWPKVRFETLEMILE